MSLADTLAYRMSAMPEWLGNTMLKMNFLRTYMFGFAMPKFRKSIPTIDPEEKLVAIANYAIKHVPYYRDLYHGLTIKSAAQFEREIGFIDKKTVMQNHDRFASDEAKDYVTMRTSGTTGVPLQLLIPANRYITEMAFVTRAWEQVGWNYGPRARVRLGQLPRGRQYLINPFTKEYIFNSALPGDDYVRLIHKVVAKNKVDTLYSYSMQAYILLQRMEGLGLDTSVFKRALLTSEPVTPMQHDYIQGKLGIAISSFYGHSEKLIFARSLDGLGNFVVEPAYGYCEIIGEGGRALSGEGERGEMTGTTFYNFAMPLLRYRTGDSAVLGKNTVDFDGVEKKVLATIEGRSDRLIIYRHDGSIISSANFSVHSPVLTRLEGLQFVQDKRGYLKVLYKPTPSFTRDDLEALRKLVAGIMFGPEYVEMIKTDEFQLTKAGKFMLVVNNTL